MAASIVTSNVAQIVKNIQAIEQKIQANRDQATKAAATALVPFVKAALPRDSKAAHPGYLRSHVHVYRMGPEAYAVKLTGQLAHLVYGNIKAHSEAPKGMEAAQVHTYNRRSHARMQGPGLAKQALSWGGRSQVYSRVIHPAHQGATSPLQRVKSEHAAEARLAAAEVLFHGKP